MTSEQIIQRLLDDKHVTVKEALILLKDITKNIASLISESHPIQGASPIKVENPIAVAYGVQPNVTVMYGVISTYDNTTWIDNSNVTNN